MKKYVDIERFKEKYDTVFSIGEQVTITEKVDGSNASFTYDPTTNTVLAFSRKNQLNEANTLNGFWNWAQQLNVSQIDMLTQHGRYVIFGEWLCLSGDTVIKKVSAGKGKKEMTLKEMYEYAHTPEEGRAKSWWERNGYPSLYSLDLETDTIRSNKMQEIVYTGKKKVYKLTTHKGYSIKATANHPFLTPKGWIELGKLSEYDCVAITDFITRNIHQRTYGIGTREIFRRQKEYKDRIGKCEVCGAINGLNLHHKDENPFHNTEDNWQVLCQDCHGNSHTKFNNQPRFDYEFDYIISIEDAGEEDCYDICMSGNENVANFIANNFIVHNCKHTIKYPETRYKNFYMFDVWDTQVEEYLPHEDTYAIFKGLENAVQLTQQVIYFVPIFYTGEFRGWDSVYQLVGQTMLGAEPCGEGVVIKSQDRLDNKNSRTPSYLKIVAEKFSEVHQDHHKPVDPEELKKREAERQYVASVATARRTEKCLQKLVDEGQLRPDWDEHDMGAIAKVLPKMMYEDCRKEEPEVVAACENFGKICGSLTMTYVRDMLKSR